MHQGAAPFDYLQAFDLVLCSGQSSHFALANGRMPGPVPFFLIYGQIAVNYGIFPIYIKIYSQNSL